MINTIKFLFNKIPSHWWRNGIRMVLVSAFTFYLLNITGDIGIIEKYRTLFIKSQFLYFVILQLVIMFVFYVLLDFILRILAFKVIKKRILAAHEKITASSKMKLLREVSEVKKTIVNFIMGYPVELGYVNPTDLKEIGSVDPIVVSEIEKEKGINEIITALNKWACVLVHLVFTLLLVWHYDKVFMTIILILGFFMTMGLYCCIIFFVKNVELLNVVIREFKRIK